MESTTEKNIATFTHLSSLTQYFIPFGNYIFPIILWSTKKNDSEFVDHNGKQVLNFQLSLLLYSLLLLTIAIPTLLISIFKDMSLNALMNSHNFEFSNFNFGANLGLLTIGIICLTIFSLLKIAEFFLIIYAAIKTSNGETYNYPITIPFIK
jgi:uncharacterized Tic20 family protein